LIITESTDLKIYSNQNPPKGDKFSMKTDPPIPNTKTQAIAPQGRTRELSTIQAGAVKIVRQSRISKAEQSVGADWNISKDE
jgi:hypothetical protein